MDGKRNRRLRLELWAGLVLSVVLLLELGLEAASFAAWLGPGQGLYYSPYAPLLPIGAGIVFGLTVWGVGRLREPMRSGATLVLWCIGNVAGLWYVLFAARLAAFFACLEQEPGGRLMLVGSRALHWKYTLAAVAVIALAGVCTSSCLLIRAILRRGHAARAR